MISRATHIGPRCRIGGTLLALFLWAGASRPVHGVTIANTGSVTYEAPAGTPFSLESNEVLLQTPPPPSPSAVEFYQYAPGVPGATSVLTDGTACGDGLGSFDPGPPLNAFAGAVIDTAVPIELAVADIYHAGEPVFLVLVDASANADPALVESVDVRVTTSGGDEELLRLDETGVNTGIFAGGVQSAAIPPDAVAFDCRLSVTVSSMLEAEYVDPSYPTDIARADALVDPLGFVFDSSSGAVIDGATVELVDAASGLPATVFGDDGVSSFPASVTSGGAVTDGGGNVHDFPPGGYRFPAIAPGDYRLLVTPPTGYTAPSAVAPADLAGLLDPDGAPYAVTASSYADPFTVAPGPALNIDVPIDPLSNNPLPSTVLLLDKLASRTEVSAGDFVQYSLTLRNTDTVAAAATTVEDTLPPGFRFRSGSLHENGVAMPDPAISADGRTLSWTLASLPAGAVVRWTYVAEVSAGTQPGDAVNRAMATRSGGGSSNVAQALVHVREPFFGNCALLIGRVVVGGCETPWDELHGLPDVRVVLEDGTYTTTDADGQYHFEGVCDGTHVVQLDRASLPPTHEPEACIDNTRFAGRGFSQFVDLRGGTLWRADFWVREKPPITAPVGIRLEATRAPANDFDYRVELDGGAASIAALRVLVQLPGGVDYVPGSGRVNGEPLEAEIAPGVLTFRLGDPGADWQRTLTFGATSADGSCPEGQHDARAVAVFDTDLAQAQRTAPAAVTLECSAPVSREAVDAPAHARGERQTAVATASAVVPARVLEEYDAAIRARLEIADDATAAGAKTDWTQVPGSDARWLFPPEGHNPRSPAVRVVIRHGAKTSVRLVVNGEDVEPISFDGTEPTADGSAAISQWRGIPITDGDNRLEAFVTDAAGTVTRLERSVHYANQPVVAAIVPGQSVLAADGVTRPVLAVRLVDRDGHPVRAGVTGPFIVRPPHVAWRQVERQQARTLAGLDRFQAMYEIEGDDGIAYIELAPTTQSGGVTLDFAFEDERIERRQELEVWLEPRAREWIVVGFAEGTVGHDSLSGNMDALDAAGREEDVYTDGQVSFHAKGRVRGDWLLTLAYDSDESDPRDGLSSLLGVIDPDEFYTIYGDGTEQRYDAPSQDNLYVRLERRQFYALFGDYETGMTHTELTRYSRVLNGFKSEFAGQRVGFTAFGSDTEQSYVRDEMQGDGTSGLYRLSRGRLVINGESISLETRDRFQSQRIVATRTLARHIDYDIDYRAGTLRFREPVPSRDAQFNPIFIVAVYEVEDGGASELNAGGRVALSFADERVEAGLTALRDDQSFTTTDVAGLDLRYRPQPATEVRFEVAGSRADSGTATTDGAGYIAEVEHHDGRWDGLAWARRVDGDFGSTQLAAAERGNFKLGALGRMRVAEDLSVEGEIGRQENLDTDVTRESAAVRVDWETEHAALSAGAQSTRDDAPGAARRESNQLIAGARSEFLDDRLDLEARGEIAVGGTSEVADQPTRYLLQAGWDLTEDARVFVAEEIYEGEDFDGSMTRVGIQSDLWQGARVSSTLNQNVNEHGPRTFALFGLSQALLVGEHWGIDLGVDHNRTLHESGTPLVIDEAHPIASGGHLSSGGLTEDFTALSGGATYRALTWSWNGRLEWRDGELDDRRSVISSFLREAQRGVAFAIGLEASDVDLEAGSEGLAASIDLSWAYRPLGRRLAVLDRLEFRYEALEAGTGGAGSGFFGATSLVGTGDLRARALINNFNLNRVSRAWQAEDRRGNLFQRVERNQWALYYGSKYVFDRYEGVDYEGYTDLVGLELRHDLRRNLDLGIQGSQLHAWESGTREYSIGPSIGFSPLVNSWITVGYNLDGFSDDDFDAARYTAEGPWVKLRFKFDEDTRLKRDADADTAAGGER